MNCFYHTDKPAIGLCKSCHKGLCGECVTETNGSIACKGRCETDVDAVEKVIRHSVKVFENRESMRRPKTTFLAQFLIALGLTTAIVSLLLGEPRIVVMGGAVIFLAGVLVRTVNKAIIKKAMDNVTGDT